MSSCLSLFVFLFFFNDTATTEIYTLSLHDALPISVFWPVWSWKVAGRSVFCEGRSEEHTSELQSPCNLVCRLLLEKKKNKINSDTMTVHLCHTDAMSVPT